jgi:hypothetical protein
MPMRGVWTTGPLAFRDRELDAARADRLAVQLGPDRERLAEAPGAAAEIEQRLAPTPLAHRLEPVVGSSARRSTASAAPSYSPHTMFSSQWMP